jgi:peptide/nickel transport system substrate-binding protein
MKRYRLPKLAVALAVVAALPFLFGFGNSSSANRTLIMAIAGTPADVDPDNYQGLPSNDTYNIFTAQLVRYKPYKQDYKQLPGPFQVDGYLASSWKIVPNGMEFTLRDAKSQWGNTLTSEDVKWSFERHSAINAISRFLFAVNNIDLKTPITVIDSKRFRMNLNNNAPMLLGSLTHYVMGITDSVEAKKHATESDPWARNWLKTNSATFGPYQVAGIQPSQVVFFKANPNHWSKPNIPAVVARAVPDASARVQLVIKGQADYTNGLEFQQAKTAEQSGNVQVTSGPTPWHDSLIPNLAFKPFSDPKVRLAVNHALDRKVILNQVYAGYGVVPATQVSSTIPTPVKVPGQLDYSIDKAKKLLAEAGYPNGFEFTLTICPCRPGAYVVPLATVVQSQLAKVGIKVNIATVSTSGEFESGRTAKRYQAWIASLGPVVIDPAYFGFLYFGTRGGQNFSNYTNAAVDKNIPLAMTTEPGKRRDRYVVNIVKALEADAPYVPLVETANLRVWSKRVSGAIMGEPVFGVNSIFADLLQIK